MKAAIEGLEIPHNFQWH